MAVVERRAGRVSFRLARGQAAVLSLCCIIVASCAGCARDLTAPPEEVVDLGPIFADEKGTDVHEWRVVNRSKRPVRVIGESHSPALGQIELAYSLLRPGESAPIRFKIRVLPGYSNNDGVCIVKTDHPAFPEWTYRLRYRSYPRAQIVPNMRDLGRFASRADEIDKSRTSAAFEFETYESATAGRERERSPLVIRAEGLTIIRGEPITDSLESDGSIRRTRYPFTAIINADDSTPGAHSRAINVIAGAPYYASASVRWLVTRDVEIVPSRVHFGLIERGKRPPERVVVVRSVGGSRFRIRSAEASRPILRVERVENQEPASSHALRLILEPSRTSAGLTGEVVVKTDHEDAPEIKIPWSYLSLPSAG